VDYFKILSQNSPGGTKDSYFSLSIYFSSVQILVAALPGNWAMKYKIVISSGSL
jgi:hypothetical protein